MLLLCLSDNLIKLCTYACISQMKDLHHEHLVRFIGASVDVPHCFMLTEYCPRGSLQDILENEQLKLDWTFRYSLMHDIVKVRGNFIYLFLACFQLFHANTNNKQIGGNEWEKGQHKSF